MGQRLDLQTLLSSLPDVKKAYYQQPSADKMVYPCIVYELDDMHSLYAANKPYRLVNRYQVTVIDRNPDSSIPQAVGYLPLSSYVRSFTMDGLHHNIFTLYF